MAEKKLSDIVVELRARNDEFTAALKKVEAQIAGTSKKVEASISKMDASFAAFGQGLKAYLSFQGLQLLQAQITGAADRMDTLGESAAKVGLSTKAFQEITIAASLAGSSIEGMQQALTIFNTQVSKGANGEKSAVEMFKRVGISVKDLQTLGLEELLNKYSDGLAKVTNAQEQVAISGALMGRTGRATVLLFRDGSGKLTEYRENVNKTGAVIDDALIQKMGTANDNIGLVTKALQVQKDTLSVQLAPSWLWLLQNINQVIAGWRMLLGQDTMPAVIRDFTRVNEAITKTEEHIASIQKGEGVSGFLNALDPARKTAQLKAQNEELVKLLAEREGILQRGRDIEAAAGAPVGAPPGGRGGGESDEEKKSREAKEKKLATIREEIAALEKESGLYQQVTQGLMSYEAAQERIAYIQGRVKGTDDQLADALTAKKLKVEQGKKAVDLYVKSLEEEFEAGRKLDSQVATTLQSKQQEIDDLMAENNIRAQGIALKRSQADIERDILEYQTKQSLIRSNVGEDAAAKIAATYAAVRAEGDKLRDAMKDDPLQPLKDSIESLKDRFSDAMAEMITTGKISAGELAQTFIQDFVRKVIDSLMDDLGDTLLNLLKGAKGQGGIIGALAGGIVGLFGGGKAAGGPVYSGKVYPVGERGPELFMPRMDGTIIPNAALQSGGMGQPVVVNQYNSFTSDVQSGVRAEILNATPYIVEQSKQAVLVATQRGGTYSNSIRGRR